jgi:hypothetical protein
MTREQRIIELAGGEYLATQDGFAWYNEPQTHSTMVMDVRTLADATDTVAIEYLKILMRNKRREFSKEQESEVGRQKSEEKSERDFSATSVASE